MITTVLGTDTLYTFELNGNDLIITFRGDCNKGVINTWKDMKRSFETQLESILHNHDVENVYFEGDKFGKGIFNLCRYELQSILKTKCHKKFKIIEDSTMKILYIEDNIFCTNRFSEECDNGLTIDVDAPLDTEFYFKKDDETFFNTVLKNGIVKVPNDVLTDGHILMYAVKPGGLPTNIIHMEVETGKKGKYISCKQDYYDLLDCVYKLTKAYYDTAKKVSAHIDGYDVV